MDSFGQKFKKLRLLRNQTQEQLINDFNKKYHYGLTKSAISQYENDKRFPEIGALIDFANYFDVSLDFMLTEKPVKNVKLQEEVDSYVIDKDKEVIRVDEYLHEFDSKLESATRIVLYGKTITKKQLTTITTAIKVGLELAKKDD